MLAVGGHVVGGHGASLIVVSVEQLHRLVALNGFSCTVMDIISVPKRQKTARVEKRRGSAWGPVILPVFKTGGRQACPGDGVFDSHALPPKLNGHLRIWGYRAW